MPHGPGKYDAFCTKVREETNAMGAVVVVISGNKGDGFSVQAPIEIAVRLPQLLRHMANQIEVLQIEDLDPET